MTNKNQITVTSTAKILPKTFSTRNEYKETCDRIFHLTSMMPEGAKFGIRFEFCKDTQPYITAFTNAELCRKDYLWVFEPCADVIWEEGYSHVQASGRNIYNFEQNGGEEFECSHCDNKLYGELCELDAALEFIISAESKQVCVTLYTADRISMRVRAMLSSLFNCAEIVEATADTMTEIGLPRKMVAENIKSMLSVFTEKKEAGETVEIEADEFDFDIDEKCDTSPLIEELYLSIRSYNCLKRYGIHTIADLRTLNNDEFMHIRNLGRKGMEEVKEKLLAYEKQHSYEAKAEPGIELSGRAALDELIGLADVKRQVKRIAALAVMQRDMKNKGLVIEPINLNMSFTGNPGTAKTTVARIMAKILYEENILPNRTPIEVGRADIVARYVGQTADNVKEIFRKAQGGLLFIDEAYSLLDDYSNGYGDEAINTIVQEMENCRGKTVVVFAGYPKPMEEFLSRNPGLRSRVPFNIDFADYSAEEMTLIAKLTAEKYGFKFCRSALEKVTELCSQAKSNAESGNGRFCRNIVENAVLSYAERVYGETGVPAEVDYTLMPEDILPLKTVRAEKIRYIGF